MSFVALKTKLFGQSHRENSNGCGFSLLLCLLCFHFATAHIVPVVPIQNRTCDTNHSNTCIITLDVNRVASTEGTVSTENLHDRSNPVPCQLV